MGGFALGLVQMVLYDIYRKGTESEKEQGLGEGVINIVWLICTILNLYIVIFHCIKFN